MDLPLQMPLVASLAFLLVSLAVYLLHRAALPKPIDGIPFDPDAAARILGDVPAALAHHKQTSEMFSFLTSQLVKHNSAIVQLLMGVESSDPPMRPLGRPWVIIADFRETQDIMIRRTREFDRSDFFGDLFINLIPKNHVVMPTGEEWKAHRRLVADTMSNAFLQGVAGPRIYETASELIALWREKARLAKGHPVNVHKDIYRTALDAIWAVCFGAAIGATTKQTQYLRDVPRLEQSADADAALDIPTAEDPEAYKSIITLSESAEIAMNSPFPRLHHGLALRWLPRLSNAKKVKDDLLKRYLDAAWRTFASGQAQDDQVRGALDLIVQREVAMAKSEGRAPEYDTQAIRDELFGFLIAGHETTSTTTCCEPRLDPPSPASIFYANTLAPGGLKFLTAHPAVQQKLRATLRAQFTRAVDAGESPSVEEIAGSSLPYLDATLEEIHRCGGTVSQARGCSDLGLALTHRSRGTDVFLLSNGPGYLTAPLPVDDSKRSKGSRDSVIRTGVWDVTDIGVFQPERWLSIDDQGAVAFDSRAGPVNAFGMGPRGCFGRKLASLELKILFVLIIWNFELVATPPALSGFAGRDIMTHTPQDVYLRLAELALTQDEPRPSGVDGC
ncbi:hypothetical protein LTR53_012922 [Teratosphaeriaceae sp. CCFEE 6253]|nr:hypothetical protein LTR53_012922 [Teratosphaeriaceae sp. CCFEE 6253]